MKKSKFDHNIIGKHFKPTLGYYKIPAWGRFPGIYAKKVWVEMYNII